MLLKRQAAILPALTSQSCCLAVRSSHCGGRLEFAGVEVTCWKGQGPLLAAPVQANVGGRCYLGVYVYVNQRGAVVLVQQHFASGQLAVQNRGLSMVQVLQQISRCHQVDKRRCVPAGPYYCLCTWQAQRAKCCLPRRACEAAVTYSSPSPRAHLHGDTDIFQDYECHLNVKIYGWVAQQITKGTALHAH